MEYAVQNDCNSKIVIAIGGNALLGEHQKGTYDEQYSNVSICADALAQIIGQGNRLVIIHGNGPQVGLLVQRAEDAADTVPTQPLFVYNAETQGQIGHQLITSLTNKLPQATVKDPVVAILTRVLVDAHDPAFDKPTKPVGSFFTKEEIENQAKFYPFKYIEDSGRGYRKVVASPSPIEIFEAPLVNEVLQTGRSVIAAGGGGLPFIKKENGELENVEAIIDKDRSAALLGINIQANILIILTGVEQVAINFNKPDMQLLSTISVSQAKKYMDDGHFPEGSMGPKIEAAITFVEKTGGRAIITSLEKAVDALKGTCGTMIIPDEAM